MSPRLQVVVAHPDDETFGCGSILLHAVAAGAVTAVCCATRGEAGQPPEGSGLAPAELGAVRERELHEAAALLGVSRVDLLGYTDSGMNGTPADGTLVGASLDDVTGAVATAIATFRPDVVVTLDASDGHRDHVRIREATLTAARGAGVPSVYLQCLPRSLLRRWVEHMQRDRPDIEHLDADVAALGTPDEDISTILDSTEHLPVREQAIALHASQTSPFEGLPDDLRRAFLGTDHLRRVLPEWSGGPVETRLPLGEEAGRG